MPQLRRNSRKHLEAERQRKQAISDRIWEVLKDEFLAEARQWMGLVPITAIVNRLANEYNSSEVEEGLAMLQYRNGTIRLKITSPGTAKSLKIGLYKCGASIPAYGFVVFEREEWGGLL